MNGDEIYPCYEVIFLDGINVICGEEKTTGEKVFIKGIPGDENFLSELSNFLNRNKVSVHHANDVIRDRLLSFL